ncbi:MAG TPA: acyltransferase [Rhizomicrobium sp.]
MKSSAFKAKRLYSIDALRGMAALAVVVWHWQHFYALGGRWATNWNRADQPFFPVLKPLYLQGWMAVDLFFAVSGFVFFWLYLDPVAERKIGAGKFAVQRFSRLYPIYVLTLLVAATLEILFRRTTGNYFIFEANDWRHFVASLFLVQQWLPPDESQSFNGPDWAVSIEVLLYVIFYAGARLGLRGPLYAALMVLLGVLVFPREGQIARGIMGFFMGGLVYYACASIAANARAKSLAVTIAAAALLSWILAIVEVYLGPIQALFQTAPQPIAHFFAANAYWIYLFGFILVVCPLTLTALALHEELFGGPYARLASLGDISYSTYMVHFPMQLSLALLALHFGWRPADFMTGLAMILFYGGMILLGALSYNYFERPMQALIRGRAKMPALSTVQ